MIKTSLKLFILTISITAIYSNCGKIAGGAPLLEFFTDSKYYFKNDSIAPGDTALIGLRCSWNGQDYLEKINIWINEEQQETIVINPTDSKGVGYG